MKVKCVSLIVAALCLAGCGKQEASTAGAATPDAQASAPEKSGSNAAAAQAFVDAQKAKTAEGPKADLNVPLTNYTTLDQADGASWLTYIAVSRANPQPSDEVKLGMFSAKYYNERDAFKKHDLAITELPPIQDNLKRFADQSYYAVAFGVRSPDGAIDIPMSFYTSYDFNTQSFALNGTDCQPIDIVSRQNVKLDLTTTGANLCALKVTDIELAKKIEQLRVANKVNARGTVYFHVDEVTSGNHVMATPTHVHIDLYDGPFWDDKAQKFASFDI